MAKYAPANDEGLKPYFIEYRDWRDIIQKIVYAEDVSTARYKAIGRGRPGVGIREARRATPDDITAVGRYRRVS